MNLRKIAKSRMSKISVKKGNPIVAHLTMEGLTEPLCLAPLPKDARWCEESDPLYRAERDCKNCAALAPRAATLAVERALGLEASRFGG